VSVFHGVPYLVTFLIYYQFLRIKCLRDSQWKYFEQSFSWTEQQKYRTELVTCNLHVMYDVPVGLFSETALETY